VDPNADVLIFLDKIHAVRLSMTADTIAFYLANIRLRSLQLRLFERKRWGDARA
jgi:hypothetical protein